MNKIYMKKFVTAAFTLLMTILTLPVVPVSASAKGSDYNGWSGDASQSKFIDDVDYRDSGFSVLYTSEGVPRKYNGAIIE